MWTVDVFTNVCVHIPTCEEIFSLFVLKPTFVRGNFTFDTKCIYKSLYTNKMYSELSYGKLK